MRMRLIPALAICLLLSCGEAAKSPVMDVQSEPGEADAVEMRAEIECIPMCDGRECGDDGCGDVCGECSMLQEACNDAGLCVPTECVNSIDCPGNLVCAKEINTCVVCVGDEDCYDGEKCGPDYLCHGHVPCVSDKDCKAEGLLCDKELQECVQCLEDTHCEDDQYCLDGLCAGMVCEPGSSRCDGETVLQCRPDGSGEDAIEDCDGGFYCANGACVAYLCVPNQRWCEDDLLLECGKEGKTSQTINDCAQEEGICLDGACEELVCEPLDTWCVTNFVAATCDALGLSASQASCPGGDYCSDGECLPMVCAPEVAFCQNNVFKVCNEQGSGIGSQDDCGAKGEYCSSEGCIETVCLPSVTFCLDDATLGHCALDGMSYGTESCPPAHYCDQGECQAWFCVPDEVACDGNSLTTCNAQGSGLLSSLNCGDAVCVEETCKPVLCEPDSVTCVDGDTLSLCSEDGTELETAACPAQHSCSGDSCLPWQCTPGQPLCVGVFATACQDDGLSPAAGGVNCSASGLLCEDGICVACQPACGGKACGDDGCGGLCGTCLSDGVCKDGQCAECNDGNDVDWDGCTNAGTIAEFRVNDVTSGSQHGTTVDTWADGSFAIVWAGAGEGVSDGIFLRRFEANGTATGPAVCLDQGGSGKRTQARVKTFTNGSYIVVWRHVEIFSRLYDANDQPLTGIIQVSTNDGGGTHTEPTVDFHTDGSHVIMWHMNNSIFAQRFTPAGEKISNNLVVSQGSGRTPSVQYLSNGEVVATYHRWHDSSGNGIFARYLSASYTPYSDQYIVNQTTNQNQEVGVLGVQSDDTLVAVWSSDKQDGSATGVFGQRFAADGTKVGPEFQANTYTSGAQGALWAQNNKIIEYRRTALAVFPTGDWVVVWESYDQQPGGAWDVYGRRFKADSTPDGPEFLINTHTANTQETCSVAVLPNGGIVTAWSSYLQDGDGWGIYAQRFGGDGKRLAH